jgi:hypothetical protein
MVCGMFAIKQQQWRIAIAFGIGFGGFALARRLGADVMTAQVVAVAVVLVLGGLQVRRVLGAMTGTSTLPLGVQMPRLSVVAYWTVPYFWYGTVYFAFLFADRVVAATAGDAAGGSFGIPAEYNLGMELALLTLLVAASGVEVAGALFGRALASEAVRPVGAETPGLVAALKAHHRRSLQLAACSILVTAVAIGWFSRHLLPDGISPQTWVTLVAGDVGYGCLALALVNGLVLFQIRRPWLVVRVFTAALVINLASGYLLSRLLGGFHAVDGLLLGAAYFAVASTLEVRRTLQHPDYAYAMAA